MKYEKMKIENIFKKYNDNYLKFELVENKKSNRPDLHAFLFLDDLFPKERDIISSASHDIIWLDVDSEEIETLTELQILELVRCGVMYDEDSLCMFI
jgi:hypothetical protein